MTPDAAGRNSAYSVVVDDRGLLVGDGNGQGLAAGQTDTFTAPARDAGLSRPAGRDGPARAAVHARTVVLSWDGGVTWRPTRRPA